MNEHSVTTYTQLYPLTAEFHPCEIKPWGKKECEFNKGVIFLHKQFILAYWGRSQIAYSRGAQSPAEDDEK